MNFIFKKKSEANTAFIFFNIVYYKKNPAVIQQNYYGASQ